MSALELQQQLDLGKVMKLKTAGWLCAGMFTLATNALATEVLDQEFSATNAVDIPVGPNLIWQQGVTAGLPGSGTSPTFPALLSSIELTYMGGLAEGQSAEFTLFVNQGAASPIVNPVTFPVKVMGNQDPDRQSPISVNVSSEKIFLDEGQPFFIGLLGIEDMPLINLRGSFLLGTYEGGNLWLGSQLLPNADLDFRTFVQQAISEPATVVLLVIGIAFLRFPWSRVRLPLPRLSTA